MDNDALDMTAVLREIALCPRRDNGAYHKAIAEARQAFADAQIALGGPVRVNTRSKVKRNGAYVVKWTFRRED